MADEKNDFHKSSLTRNVLSKIDLWTFLEFTVKKKKDETAILNIKPVLNRRR